MAEGLGSLKGKLVLADDWDSRDSQQTCGPRCGLYRPDPSDEVNVMGFMYLHLSYKEREDAGGLPQLVTTPVYWNQVDG